LRGQVYTFDYFGFSANLLSPSLRSPALEPDFSHLHLLVKSVDLTPIPFDLTPHPLSEHLLHLCKKFDFSEKAKRRSAAFMPEKGVLLHESGKMFRNGVCGQVHRRGA
jgi:hypothetical protein